MSKIKFPYCTCFTGTLYTSIHLTRRSTRSGSPEAGKFGSISVAHFTWKSLTALGYTFLLKNIRATSGLSSSISALSVTLGRIYVSWSLLCKHGWNMTLKICEVCLTVFVIILSLWRKRWFFTSCSLVQYNLNNVIARTLIKNKLKSLLSPDWVQSS